MANPIAKIRLGDFATSPAGASDRGIFSTSHGANGLSSQAAYGDGDIAQVYPLQRVYKFDAASLDVDLGDGVTVLPGNLTVGVPGRWLSTSSAVGLYSYFSIPLHGKLSEVFDGAILDVLDPESYVWSLASNPFPDEPNAILVPSGDTAILKVPVTPNYRPGGTLVFLRVKDNLGRISLNNPFSPFLNVDALFHYILATPNSGLRIPAAGVRNWHTDYRETIAQIDEELTATAPVPGSSTQATTDDKNLSPLASSGDEAATGIAITKTPVNDGYVRVYVNGIAAVVGDGLKDKECYFSSDSGVTAKTVATIQLGDQLYWNGNVAGYGLAITDVIELDYMVTL